MDLEGSDPLTNNLSHKRDMIKPHGCWIHYDHIVMFTIETTPSHVMIGHGLVDMDHVIT